MRSCPHSSSLTHLRGASFTNYLSITILTLPLHSSSAWCTGYFLTVCVRAHTSLTWRSCRSVACAPVCEIQRVLKLRCREGRRVFSVSFQIGPNVFPRFVSEPGVRVTAGCSHRGSWGRWGCWRSDGGGEPRETCSGCLRLISARRKLLSSCSSVKLYSIYSVGRYSGSCCQCGPNCSLLIYWTSVE